MSMRALAALRVSPGSTAVGAAPAPPLRVIGFPDRFAAENVTAAEGAAFPNMQAEKTRGFEAEAANECGMVFVERVSEELFGSALVAEFVVIHDFQGDALAGAEFVGESGHGDGLDVSGASPR